MPEGGLLQDGMHQLSEEHMGGKKDGFIATGVMEIMYEERQESDNRSDA